MMLNLSNGECIMADESPIKPGWKTAKEIYDLYQIPEGTLREWAREGKITGKKIAVGNFRAGITFYWVEDVERQMANWKRRGAGG